MAPTRVGLVGYGLMGSSLCVRLANQGYDVRVYNRSPLRHTLPETCTRSESLDDLVALSDMIIFTVSDYGAIEDVLSRISSLAGKRILQMATISPRQTAMASARVDQLSGNYIECPVLGSKPEASSGTLLGMVGPDHRIDDQCLDLFRDIFSSWRVFSDLGQASTVKLSMNFLILALTSSFSIALSYIIQNKIDVEDFMAILRPSALFAKTFDKKLGAMRSDSFENPNFPTKHLYKDANLFCRDMGDATINSAVCHALLGVVEEAIKNGSADLDYSSIYRVFSQKSS